MPRLRPYKDKKKVRSFNPIKEKKRTWELIQSMAENMIEVKMEESGEPFSKSIWHKTN